MNISEKTLSAKEVVELVSNLKEMKQDTIHTYALSHTHDIKPEKKYIDAPYDLEVFEIICAYVQYGIAEIEQGYGADQTDMIEILTSLYDCKETQDSWKAVYEIDLYENWEIYCGLSEKIMKIPSLKRDGAKELYNKHVEEFYSLHPSWRPVTTKVLINE